MFARLVIVSLFLLTACASGPPAWQYDEQQAHAHYAQALAATDPEQRAFHMKLAFMHMKQAQQIYLVELQADRNMRAGVAAAAVQAYGAQQSALIGAGAVDDADSDSTVCIPSGGLLICP